MKRSGFTLIELLIVVAAILLIAGFAVSQIVDIDDVNISRLRNDGMILEDAANRYRLENDVWPKSSSLSVSELIDEGMLDINKSDWQKTEVMCIDSEEWMQVQDVNEDFYLLCGRRLEDYVDISSNVGKFLFTNPSVYLNKSLADKSTEDIDDYYEGMEEHEVTFGDTAGGDLYGDGTYNYGEYATIEAVPEMGYEFIKWESGGEKITEEERYSFEVTADRHFEAYFEEIEMYDVFLESSEGGEAHGDEGLHEKGTEITVWANAQTGYEFAKWEEDGEKITEEERYEFELEEDRILKAVFETQKYPVTLSPDPEEAGELEGEGEYEYGTEVELGYTPDIGYEFDSWLARFGTPQIEDDVLYVDRGYDLIGQFEITYHNIDTQTEGEGHVDPDNPEVKHGDSVSLEANPGTNYAFYEWSGDTEGDSTSIQLQEVIEDKQITAHFVELYEITVESSPDPGHIDPPQEPDGAGTYKEFEEVELQAYGEEAYEFQGWYLDDDQQTINKTYTFPASDLDLNNPAFTANYEIKEYDITTDSNDGGNTSGSGTYEHGKTVELEANPEEGYRFVEWQENGNTVKESELYSFEAEEDRNLTAEFEPKIYEISAEIDSDYGTVEPSTIEKQYGQEITLDSENADIEIDSGDHFNFDKWEEDGAKISDNKELTLTVEEDRELIARCKPEEYEFWVGSWGGGDVDPSYLTSPYKPYGYEVTIEAIPDEHYKLEGWHENSIGNIVSEEKEIEIEIRDEIIDGNEIGYVATFEGIEHDISVSSTYGGNTKPEDPEEYKWYEGEEETVEAIPEEGYEFVEWTEDGQTISENKVYEFTVEEDRDLVAHFELRHNIETSSTEGGSTEGSGTYGDNETVALEAIPEEGYEFVEWTEDGQRISKQKWYEFTAKRDRSLKAHFELKEYNIETDSTEDGGTDGGGVYKYGETAKLEANPYGNYEFEKWTEDEQEVSQNEVYEFTVKEDRNLKAHFELCISLEKADVYNAGDITFKNVYYADNYLYASSGGAGEDSKIYKIDPDDMSSVHICAEHDDISDLAYVDGHLYVASARDVLKINSNDMSLVDTYTEHSSTVTSIHYCPNGYLYSGCADEEAHKIRYNYMSQEASYRHIRNRVQDIRYVDSYVYVLCRDSVYKLDPADNMSREDRKGVDSLVRQIANCSNGYLYIGYTGSVAKIDPDNMSQIDIYDDAFATSDVFYGPDGYLYVSSGDILKIDPSDMSVVDTYTEHSGTAHNIHSCPDGYLYIVTHHGEVHKIK